MRVPVVLQVGEAEVDLELDILDHAAGITVADVVDAVLGGPGPQGAALLVDGRPVPLGSTVEAAGIVAGSVLRWAAEGERSPASVATVAVVGGLRAGDTFSVPAGSLVIGSSREAAVCLADAGLSGRHARLDMSADGDAVITDLHSHDGVTVNEVRIDRPTSVTGEDEVAFGRVRVRIRPLTSRAERVARSHARTVTGRLAVHRHPRPEDRRLAGQNRPRPVAPPEVTAARTVPPRPPWAAIVAPAVLGLVLAVVFGPTMAIFALLGPVMAVVSWLDERRRVRRDRRQQDREHEAAMAAFARAVETAYSLARGEAAARHPDPVDVVQRAVDRDPRVWERRPVDDDFLEVSVGTGDAPWPDAPGCPSAGEAAEIVAARRTLAGVPVGIDLLAARSLGIAGRAGDADAVARWLLLQIAVHHSPADVRITIVDTGWSRADGWDWTKWLPHTGGSGDDERPAHEVVLIDPRGAAADAAAITSRALRSHPRAVVIVLAERATELPSVCRATVEINASGTAVVVTGEGRRSVVVDGVTRRAARRAARALAPLVDADADGSEPSAGRLPATVTLDDLLEGPATAEQIRCRWRRAGAVPRLAAAVGVTADGPVVVDLGRDGPHGLVAGTTGSGKSELLRTLVAGLAANVDPEHLNVILVDFKGGSAFAPLARLPHVVGFVTDLDEHLAARALRSLEAELRRRERCLRSAGAEDLRSYLEGGHGAEEPLPALLVVIDEFATLVADLPGFVEALVDVAQRGRSLGIHLILATQRPAGAVGGNLRANTNLRVALRVQDEADSVDVIGTPAAATVGRATPGRGYARTGQGEIVAFQAATTAARREGGGVEAARSAVAVRPFVLRSVSDQPGGDAADDGARGAPTDRVDLLAPLVDAIVTAASDAGFAPPAPPWVEPLPERLDLDDLPAAAAGVVPLGLADDPDNQCRHLYGWHEGVGNLALIGDPARSGDALITFGTSAARTRPADRLYIYGLDFGPGRLAALAGWPHTGAVIGAAERDRQERLIRMLAEEVDRRRTGGAQEAPTILLLVDNYAAFHAAFDDLPGLPWRERLVRVFADGPALGVVTAVAADRPSALPPSAAAAFAERLVFRLADPLDGHLVGVAPRLVTGLPAGRAVHVASGLEVQWASADPRLDPPAPAAAARKAPPVDTLPDTVDVDALPAPWLGGAGWLLPVGLGDDLGPAVLPVAPGEPVLVAGAARSGRSTALALVAETVRRARPDAQVHAIALRPSPLRSVEGVRCATVRAEVAAVLDAAAAADGRAHVLLVDDAEVVEDPSGALERLADPCSTVALVVAGRSDVLRARFGHWTAAVRRSGVGVVLRPRPELDGDLWQVPLPRSSTPLGPGRGYLVLHGEVGLVQLAQPASAIAMTRSCDLASVESPQ